eukprot:TRINITY_DN2154_c0_g1_i1.p1 TRINITY_DN2154_c0_g1~~TRINITY_DN2154_c0_g1_i1.p1  ORF type:complete len:479 (-),score=101.45 TRINITY_DN2154_c0_g1_i1:69-1505(-)
MNKIELNDATKKWMLVGVTGVAVGLGAYYYFNRGGSSKGEVSLDGLWRRSMDLSIDQMREIVKQFHLEMDKGLQGKSGDLKMLPSFVGKPTGKESGHFLALDLGGTNFRVIKLELHNGTVNQEIQKQQYTIPVTAMTGTETELFDFIALSVKNFIDSANLNADAEVPLGFTFSFPVNQTGVASGTLITWTKGFTTSGVEGNDVVHLLKEALLRNNVRVKIAALANDTVGTMVARSYTDPKCEMGVILGTGSNGCYIESVRNITKFQSDTKLSSMIINMEWGGFGDYSKCLPLTREDRLLDAASLNPSKQLFEKMISGMYLGEIVRLVLLGLIDNGQLTGFSSSEVLKHPYKFETSYLTRIINDKSANLDDIKALLEEKLAAVSTLEDRKLLKEVCKSVARRAARLSATAIAAVLSKINRLYDTTVAVDGGVYEHIPGFKDDMDEAIKELYPSSKVQLVLQKDGSGNGAAIIAATMHAI